MIWGLMALAVVLAIGALAAAPFLAENRRHLPDETDALGEFAQLSQGRTHYWWTGKARGPVAVLVHGLTTPSLVWEALAEELDQMGYRVLGYDLYGRGWSDRAPGPQDSAFFLRQLDDLIDDQRVTDDITLVGYSMGGAIATAYAAAHPERVRRLVLLAPAGMVPVTSRRVRRLLNRPRLGEWLFLATYGRKLRQGILAEADQPSFVPGLSDTQLGELNKRGFLPAVLASLRGILAEDREADHRRLGREAVPVVAIWGTEDKVVPLTGMAVLAQWNRTAHQHQVEGAGHGLTYTHTEDIAEILREEFRETPA